MKKNKINAENFEQVNIGVLSKLEELTVMTPQEAKTKDNKSATTIIKLHIGTIKTLLDKGFTKKFIMEQLKEAGLDIKLTTFNTITTKLLNEMEVSEEIIDSKKEDIKELNLLEED